MPVCNVINSKRVLSSISEEVETLKLFFVKDKDKTNIVCFFNEKITLKHLKNVKFFDLIIRL